MKRKLIILVATLIIVPALYLGLDRTGLIHGMGMMGSGRGGGMMDTGMGRGAMSGASVIHAWMAGATLPLDLNTRRPTENEANIKAGQKIFQKRCASCHGSMGDGFGMQVDQLITPPADFTSGVFKFRSTKGFAPSNLDLFKTVSRGLHGTAMLPWPTLTTKEKWQAVYYVKTFTDLFEDEEPESVAVPELRVSQDEAVKLGREIYLKAKCNECHGLEGRGDGEKSDKLKDDKMRKIRPRNFQEEILKRGLNIEEIYWTVATGILGTPMEPYSKTLKPDEMLAVAHYVKSIARKPSKASGGMGMMGGGGKGSPDEHQGMMMIMMQKR